MRPTPRKGTTTSKTNGDLSVPIHLRNAPTKLMKELGYGEEYKYSHDYQKIFADQEYLPEALKNTFVQVPEIILENTTREFLKNRWKINIDY
jgi:putative ATPase